MIEIDTSEVDALEEQLRAGVVDAVVADTAHVAVPDIAEATRDAVRAEGRRHRRTGRMDRSITVGVDGTGEHTTALLGASSATRIVVAGARAHEIRSLAGRVLPLGKPAVEFAAFVHHPGTRADPFVARGLAAATGEIGAIADDAARHTAAELAARLEG